MQDSMDFDDPQFMNFLKAYGSKADDAAISSIFIPGVLNKRFQAFQHQTRFAHYTTAETAMSIIRNRCVWLRNANGMNDYSELHHGISQVISFFGSDKAESFWSRLNDLHEGLANEIKQLYDGWLNDLKYNTYMICVSEHHEKEDLIGRLSMWRAYGQPNGVALVFNGAVFHSTSDALKTYSHPVFYYSKEEVVEVFEGIVAAVVSSKQLQAQPRDDLKSRVHHMLETFSLGLKHPGFMEELEWRIVHRPGQDSTDVVPRRTEIIRGVPQRIHSIPLQDSEGLGIKGIEIPNLIERIIVGPCQHPFIIREALLDELNAAGVANAESRVVVSDIPLRT